MITSFSEFGLAEPIQRAIADLGFKTPTPIQAQAIPVVLQGTDVMGAAQTGTGKTAGFGLPILQRLMPHANTSASPARHPVRSLILAPTRELADQIFVNMRDYAKYTGLRCTAVFGGVDMNPQVAALRSGCEVLIATPGRLLDHMQQKNVSLSQVEVLVLDEADRMLDMGFLPDIQRIVRTLPATRQSLMFSATFSNEIRKLAQTFLSDPQTIEVAARNAAAENVEQIVYRVQDAEGKRAAVARLVRERDISQVIVFTNTKIGAGRLARQLEKDGLNANAIHGDKSQTERLATLDAFKKGEITVLVATDVAARGLDIAELPAVINYDLPYSPEDYIHRIGRTGRAGASGIALSLMVGGDERFLADIEKLIRRKLPVETIDIAPSPRPRRAEGDERAARGPAREPSRESSRDPSREPSRESVGRGPREAGRGTDRTRPPRDRHAPRNLLGAANHDPIFSQPYEPAPVRAEIAAEVVPADPVPAPAVSGGIRRPQRPLAALLGGRKGS